MKYLTSNARIAEYANVGTNITLFYNEMIEVLESDLFLKTVIAGIDELSQNITTAYNQDKIKSELEEADATRDEAVRGLGSLIDGYVSIPIAAKQTAAKALKAVYDKYGKKIVGSSYSVETTQINSLLEDLSAESLADSITALDGMTESIEALRTAQTNFDTLYVSYTTAMSTKADAASSYRKPLLSDINDKLVPYLSAVALVFPDTYSPFADNIESVITAMNTTVQKRSKTTSTTESSETTTETTE